MAGEVCTHTVTSGGQTFTCGQVHDPRKCTGHANIRDDDGKAWSGTTRPLLGIRPCKRYPLTGLEVCGSHGGNGGRKGKENTRAVGKRRVAEEKAMTKVGRPPDPAVAQRRAEALELRRDGSRYEDIAAALGYASRHAARLDVQRAMATMVGEASEEVRALELERLDAMWQAALEVLRREHVTVSHGRVIRDDDGTKILDDGPVLQAIDRLLRIQERRAKLLGLDAPTKHEVVSLDAIDAEIRRLNEELARADELERAEAGEAAGAEATQG